LLIVVAVVPPVELHLSVFDLQDPMIGNRDPVGVAADVVIISLPPARRAAGSSNRALR
jgi:hypothetical protein